MSKHKIEVEIPDGDACETQWEQCPFDGCVKCSNPERPSSVDGFRRHAKDAPTRLRLDWCLETYGRFSADDLIRKYGLAPDEKWTRLRDYLSAMIASGDPDKPEIVEMRRWMGFVQREMKRLDDNRVTPGEWARLVDKRRSEQ